MSSWCSSYPSGLLNSIISWAYPFEGLLITFTIKSKLLNWVHKALYDLATVYLFSPLLLLSLCTMISSHSELLLYNGTCHALPWPSYYPCILSAQFPFILGPHFLQDNWETGAPPVSTFSSRTPPRVHYRLNVAVNSVSVLFRARFQLLTIWVKELGKAH